MLSLSYPWLLLALPLPLLVHWLGRAYLSETDAVQSPFFARLASFSGIEPGRGAAILNRTTVQRLGIITVWLLTVAALCRPQWIGDPIVENRSARDLMLAVDLSGSMEAEDFIGIDGQKRQRLDGLKRVLEPFILGRDKDRVGLIVFGSAPYLQAPFTSDLELLVELLEETQVRMAGPRTVIGDAIGLAIKHFASSDSANRVLILVTDGNDTDSQVPPLQAARVAADEGITVHVVAIGDPRNGGRRRP